MAGLGLSGPEAARLIHFINTESARAEQRMKDNADAVEENKESKVESLADMDPEERQQWLRAIIGHSAGVETDGNRLRQHLHALHTQMDTLTIEQIRNHLEELIFLCELTHNANSLHQLGGLDTILNLLAHSDDTIRLHSADIIAIGASNNPKFQNQVYAVNGVGRLTVALENEVVPGVRAKLWSAVSHLCRNHNPNLNVFLSYDGSRILGSSLREEDDGRQMLRICRFVNYLLADWQDSNPVVMRVLNVFGDIEICLERDLVVGDPEILCVLMEGLVLFIERDVDRKKYLVMETNAVVVALRLKERLGGIAEEENEYLVESLKQIEKLLVLTDRYQRYDGSGQGDNYSTEMVVYATKDADEMAA